MPRHDGLVNLIPPSADIRGWPSLFHAAASTPPHFPRELFHSNGFHATSRQAPRDEAEAKLDHQAAPNEYGNYFPSPRHDPETVAIVVFLKPFPCCPKQLTAMIDA
jgi:hypothetical protein